MNDRLAEALLLTIEPVPAAAAARKMIEPLGDPLRRSELTSLALMPRLPAWLTQRRLHALPRQRPTLANASTANPATAATSCSPNYDWTDARAPRSAPQVPDHRQHPSRRSIAPISPVRVHASASRRTRSLYSALKRRRRGRSASSGSGTTPLDEDDPPAGPLPSPPAPCDTRRAISEPLSSFDESNIPALQSRPQAQ